MSKIIVGGCGHGGIVAAIKLSRAGHEVFVYEKASEGALGMDQTDAFDGDTFSYAGLEPSPSFGRGTNIISFYPEDRSLEPLTIPGVDEPSFLVERKELIEYLISLAVEVGVIIQYDTEIKAPIVLGNRVVGIKTSSGDFYGDLIIDACGVNSPLRSNLPDFFSVNREIKKYDIVHSYRAYFDRANSDFTPKTDYNLYLRDDGTVGFSWLITEPDKTDALICRFYKPDDDEILTVLREMQEENPHMGSRLIRGGARGIIPVCQPLGILVCDGYAALGDSAFMTIPLKGSGITYSFKAGTLLADCVLKDTRGYYDTENLWEYQNGFFKEIGFSACHIAIMKNILPYLTAEQVNDLFRLGIITSEEIEEIVVDKARSIFSKQGIASIRNKIKLASDNVTIKEILSNLAVWMGKFAVIEASYPTKYDRRSAEKWVEKYNNFFDSIRRED